MCEANVIYFNFFKFKHFGCDFAGISLATYNSTFCTCLDKTDFTCHAPVSANASKPNYCSYHVIASQSKNRIKKVLITLLIS